MVGELETRSYRKTMAGSGEEVPQMTEPGRCDAMRFTPGGCAEANAEQSSKSDRVKAVILRI